MARSPRLSAAIARHRGAGDERGAGRRQSTDTAGDLRCGGARLGDLAGGGSHLGGRDHHRGLGLGDKIELAKSPWIRDFDGKSLESPPPEQWAVKKDGGVFDQFAGATITPRAVVKAVKQGMTFYAAHRQEILEGK